MSEDRVRWRQTAERKRKRVGLVYDGSMPVLYSVLLPWFTGTLKGTKSSLKRAGEESDLFFLPSVRR